MRLLPRGEEGKLRYKINEQIALPAERGSDETGPNMAFSRPRAA